MSHECAVWGEMKHLILVNLLTLPIFMFILPLFLLEGVRELFQESYQISLSFVE